jgi:hypothetical protein
VLASLFGTSKLKIQKSEIGGGRYYPLGPAGLLGRTSAPGRELHGQREVTRRSHQNGLIDIDSRRKPKILLFLNETPAPIKMPFGN